MKYDLGLYLENWQAQQPPSDGVKLYDFGDNVSAMPIITNQPDGTQTYLTRSICFLWMPNGKPFDGEFTSETGEIRDLGNQNYFIRIEIRHGATRDEIFSSLDSAKEKLLTEVRQRNRGIAGAGGD